MKNTFDDFGNLISCVPSSSSSSSSDDYVDDDNERMIGENYSASDSNIITTPMEIDGVDIVHQEIDAQSIQEPILKATKPLSLIYSRPSFTFPPPSNDKEEEANKEFLDYDPSFLASMLSCSEAPDRNTVVCLVGTIHVGKTSLLDLVHHSQHQKDRNIFYSTKESETAFKENSRLLDRFTLEKKRGITLHLKPLTIPIITDSKTSIMQFIDTPGHSDFYQDVLNGLQVSDRKILVIDAAQGITKQTEALIHHLKNDDDGDSGGGSGGGIKSFIVIINKIDRLILELRLTPLDSYMKLLHSVKSINEIMGEEYFSPAKGNVLFSSALHGYLFSVSSFVSSTLSPSELNLFTRYLWGSFYHSPEDGSITTTPQKKKGPSSKPIFVTWIMEPLYKLYNSALIEVPLDGCKLSPKTATAFLPRIRQTMAYFLTSKKISERGLKGSTFMGQFRALLNEDSSWKPKPMDQNTTVIKSYPLDRDGTFEYLVRSPTDLRVGDLFLDKYQITHISIPLGLSRINVCQVRSGTLTLLRFSVGAADGIAATTSITKDLPLSISIETIDPSLDSALSKALPLMVGHFYTGASFATKADSRYDLKGPGELYFDSLLSDLRDIFLLPLRLSTPTPSFCESIADTSPIIVDSDPLSSSGTYISLIAEPFNKEEGLDALSVRSIISQSTSNYLIDDRMDKGFSCEAEAEAERSIVSLLKKTFHWVCGEGPLLRSKLTGVVFRLVDLVLDDSNDDGHNGHSSSLSSSSMTTTTSTTSTKTRIKEVQAIPALRRCFHSLLLISRPVILEPLLLSEIIATRPDERSLLTNGSIKEGEDALLLLNGRRPQIKDLSSLFGELLQRRRGHLIGGGTDLPGTPQTSFLAIVPYLDYPGMEVDIRVSTLGMAHPQTIVLGKKFLKKEEDVVAAAGGAAKNVSSHKGYPSFQVVTGDPLDWRLDSRYSMLMEPAPAPYLGRDIMLKERRREGHDGGIGGEVVDVDLFSSKTLEKLRKDDLYKDLGLDCLFFSKKRN